MELLFVSSQLASTLRMDLHILPVVASLLTERPAEAAGAGGPTGGPAAEVPEAASRMPVLEVTDLNASATVQLIGCAFSNPTHPRTRQSAPAFFRRSLTLIASSRPHACVAWVCRVHKYDTLS